MSRSKATKKQEPVEEERKEREEPRPKMTRAVVVSNGTVRHIVQILMNGARMSEHPHVNFEAHRVLLQQMRLAYERGEEERFLSHLKDYLVQAAGKLPHAGRAEDVEETINDLKRLIHSYDGDGESENGGGGKGENKSEGGFYETARYLLSSAHAPVDRF